MSREHFQPEKQSRWRKYAVIAGVVALLLVVFWTLGGRSAWTNWRESKVPRDLAAIFVRDLSNGDIDSAKAQCSPMITATYLREMSEKLDSLGKFEDLAIFDRHLLHQGGAVFCRLKGTARFAQATRGFEINLVKQNDKWTITEAQISS